MIPISQTEMLAIAHPFYPHSQSATFRKTRIATKREIDHRHAWRGGNILSIGSLHYKDLALESCGEVS